MRTRGLLLAFLLIAGCATEVRLKEILAGILPLSPQLSLTETCSKFLGPTVVLFSNASLTSEEDIINHVVEGLWIRSSSLIEFADVDAQTYRGAGVGATILDGKNCLREITAEAEEILFGSKTGLYYRSENREIVAILFDEPKGHGVMFLQAP